MSDRYGYIGTISQNCDSDPSESCGGTCLTCTTVRRCFKDKCFQVAIQGFSDGTCGCCSEVNQTYTTNQSLYQQPTNSEADCGCLFDAWEAAPLTGYFTGTGGGDCCISWGIGVIGGFFCSPPPEVPVFGVDVQTFSGHPGGGNYTLVSWRVTGDEALDVMARVCAGEEVTLDFSSIFSLPEGDGESGVCTQDGSTATIKIVECATPPTPDGTCDGFTDCEEFQPMSAWFALFGDCDYSGSQPTFGAFTGHKLWGDLNEVIGAGPIFELIPGTSPYATCSAAGGEVPWHIILGRPDTSDYSDPGIKIEWLEFDTPTHHEETYLWCLTIWLECDAGTGKAQISRIGFDIQTFTGDEGTNWPPTSTGTASSNCISFLTPCTPDNDGQLVTDCGLSAQLIREFYYDKCDGGATSCFQANVVL